MEARDRENFLIHLMNIGFEKAAVSFSKLINKQVRIVAAQSILVRHADEFSYISEEQGDLYILVTHVIGDISGKSFLIFSQEESKEIFKTLNNPTSNTTLNEAFLMEIDNIISASVITEISNSLDIEIYGDVPQLYKIHAKDFQTFLAKEADHDGTSSMIFSNATFQFDRKDRVHPQFIWRLNSRIFDRIPTKRMTV